MIQLLDRIDIWCHTRSDNKLPTRDECPVFFGHLYYRHSGTDIVKKIKLVISYTIERVKQMLGNRKDFREQYLKEAIHKNDSAKFFNKMEVAADKIRNNI